MWTRLHSTKGQVALMVALIFQVLFVFFAMIINVGLVVHDKIVVQNAADIGAYYAAQRQSEILNHLAHINYQIRQANKLLAFRYWVVGTMGYDNHPFRINTTDTKDMLFIPESVNCKNSGVDPAKCLTERDEWKVAEAPADADFMQFFNGVNDYVPAICVAHEKFANFATSANGGQTYCKSYKMAVPNIPPFNIVGGVFVDDLQTTIDGVRAAFSNECRKFGSINWFYAAKIFSIYKHDIKVRRRMFDALASNLQKPGDEILDISGSKMREGIEKSIKKNLPSSVEEVEVQFLNSPEKCNSGGAELFHANVINPDLYWSDATDGASCETKPKSLVDNSQNPLNSTPQYANEYPDIYNPALANYVKTTGPENERAITGYEKNPWCMVYAGVKVKVKSRKLFSPFGAPTEIVAESYAQPFGSTIGPWAFETWLPSSNKSNNTNYNTRTDHMLPTRYEGSALLKPRPINYSRYPGDRLGLASRQAQGAFGKLVQGPNDKFDLAWFKHWDNLRDFDEKHGDPLVYDSNNADNIWRKIEIAAIAPDRFDQMYYNIDSDYWGNYLSQTAGKFNGLNAVVGDYGTNKTENKTSLVTIGRTYNSSSPQLDYIAPLRQAVATGNIPVAPYILGGATPLESVGSLLTWFKPSGAYEYSYNSSIMGVCRTGALNANEPPTSGGCIDGGRTGYSVRIVNRQFLDSDKHKLGGANSPQSKIMNAPKDAQF